MPICYNCQAIRVVSVNEIFNDKCRHVRLKYHSIWELLEKNVITIFDVRSLENLTDLMIKGLSRALVENTSIGMRPCPTLVGSTVTKILPTNEEIPNNGFKGKNKLLE